MARNPKTASNPGMMTSMTAKGIFSFRDHAADAGKDAFSHNAEKKPPMNLHTSRISSENLGELIAVKIVARKL